MTVNSDFDSGIMQSDLEPLFCFRTKQNGPRVKPPKNVTTAEGKKRVEIPFFLVYFPVLKRLNQHIKLLWFQQQRTVFFYVTNYLLCDDDCDHTGGAGDSPAKPSGSHHLWGFAQCVSPIRPHCSNLWPALEPLTSYQLGKKHWENWAVSCFWISIMT